MSRARRQTLWTAALFAGALALSFSHLFLGQVSAGRDLYRLFIPETAYLQERLLQGELPLWVARERLGQPFLALLYTQVFYAPRVALAVLFGGVWGTNLLIVFHAGLASAGAYLASRRLGAGRWAALLAGTFGLTPFFSRLGASQHAASAVAWSGVLLVLALNLARAPSPWKAALLAVGLGTSAACGAPEMLVWQGALVVLAALWSKQPVRALKWLLAAGAWGVALSAVFLLPAAELARSWARPGERAWDTLIWSTNPLQLLALGMPLVDTPRDRYADQWFVTSLFLGTLPCLFALAAVRRRLKLAPLLLLALGCTVLSLGRYFPLSAWLIGLPPLSLFRYPVKYLFGACFAIAVLAPLGLQRAAALARQRRASLRAGLVVFAGGVLLLGVAVKLAALGPWRAGVSSGVFWAGAFAAAALLVWVATPGGRARGRRVRALLLVLAGVELLAARQLIPGSGEVEASKLTGPSRLAAALRTEPLGRLSILQEDGDVPESVPGEGRLFAVEKSRENLLGLRFLEERLSIVEGYGFRDPWRLADATLGAPRAAYDFFGVTHYLRAGPPPFPDLVELDATGGWMHAYRSSTALPRAFVVHEAEVVPDAVALAALRADAQVLRRKVLLASGEPGAAAAGCDSTAVFVEAREEHLRLEVQACAPGHLVVTDTYDEGWVAELDGAATPIVRADFLVRAVAVPQGRHTVTMDYRPKSFQAGASISGLALAAVALTWAQTRRRRP